MAAPLTQISKATESFRVHQSVPAVCVHVDSEVHPFFEAGAKLPELSSPGGNLSQLVGERAALIHRAAPRCRRVVAQRDDGRWLCLSCIEPHTVKSLSGPGAYSPMRYATTEKARRAKRIAAGRCAECGALRGVHGTNRLCARHRAMAAARKRRRRERALQALRENLYHQYLAP